MAALSLSFLSIASGLRVSSREVLKGSYRFAASGQLVNMGDKAAAEPSTSGRANFVTEGKATISLSGNDVFYNKAQVVNRDISVAVLRWFVKVLQAEGPSKKNARVKPPKNAVFNRKTGPAGPVVLEGLAATGLRAIRYAREVAGLGQVIANDVDADAVAAMHTNVSANEVRDRVTVSNDDARIVMLRHPQFFDAVDLDPYGSPTELLDAAVQAVADGGLLLVTATDVAVLAGNTAESCFTKYGSYSIHRDYHHEQALRILLACIARHAARHKRAIEPVLCLSIDFYVRLFVRVRASAADSKRCASELAYVWQSTGCDSWWLQAVGTAAHGGDKGPPRFHCGKGPAVPEMCPISGGRFHMGGPIWAKPMFNPVAVEAIYGEIDRNKAEYQASAKLLGLLRVAREELHDVPLYYTVSGLAKTLRCSSPKMELLRSALVNAGHRASTTHCHPGGFKTDAPPEAVWDIMRCWAKKCSITARDPESYQAKILAKEPSFEANFARAKGALSESRAKGEPRFVQNPEHWGPRPKHGRPPLAHEVNGAAEEKDRDTKRARGL